MSVLEPELLGGMPIAPVADLPTITIETGTWKYMEPHYEDKLPPCSQACPAGNDISKAIALLATGDVDGAARLWRAGNPLPSTLGRVCPHFCEGKCNRETLGGAIAVHMLERFLGDVSLGKNLVPPAAPSTGRTIAVVGAGPAGIAAAYALALGGHSVEVFDDKPRPGGYLRTGIPDYRLPKEILDRELALVERAGVKFTQNTRIGRDISFGDLRRRFDAIIVAVGLHGSRPLGVPGNDHPQVYDGVHLLEQILLGKVPEVPRGEIAVIGGGNTAVDVARSLLRLGAKPTIVYRRTEAEMPAIASEVEQAKQEGVKFLMLAAPSTVIVENGAIAGLECNRMRLGEPDASGRRAPVVIPDSRFRLPVAGVVSAIGESLDLAFLPEALRKQIAGTPGIFVTGDAATGEGTVTAAVGSGRRVAAVVDGYLKNGRAGQEPALQSLWQREVNTRQVVELKQLNTAYIGEESRPEIPSSIHQAPTSFDELIAGFDLDAALREARRCIACGTCNGCLNCYYWCPDMAIQGRSASNFQIDAAHCKGCGICVEECPRGAIALQEAIR